MKKLLLILLCLPMMTLAQQTYVPDDNFEAYLEANGMGNGIANDDYVTTANINSVLGLDLDGESITDLTGIEDFTDLMGLECRYNQITSLDITQNTALVSLRCYGNLLTSIDLSQNINLTFLNVGSPQDLVGNQLTSLDISNNIALETLACTSNQIECLDISNNTALTELYCNYNSLEQLNTKNGNWANIEELDASNNNNLMCVEVDNINVASDPNGDWYFDSFTTITTNCNYTNPCATVSAIQEQTTNKELLKVTDLLGRETKQTNQPLFYIYDDGTVEKRITIE